MEMKPFERGTNTTDREGLDIAKGGGETSFIFSNPTGGDNIDTLRQRINIQEIPLYKRVDEFINYLNKNGYSVDARLKDFEYKPNNESKMQLYFKRSDGKEIELLRATKGEFRTIDAIVKDLAGIGMIQLRINQLSEKLAFMETNPLKATEEIEKEIVSMSTISLDSISENQQLIEETVDEREKRELLEENKRLKERGEHLEQLEREVRGYKHKIDTIHCQIRVSTANLEELKASLNHERQKLIDHKGTSMSREDIEKRIEDIEAEIEARKEALAILKLMALKNQCIGF